VGSVFAADALGGKLDRRQRVLDLVRDAPGHVRPGRGALRESVRHVVESHDMSMFSIIRVPVDPTMKLRPSCQPGSDCLPTSPDARVTA
jgi:hypothetical protein